MAFKEEPQDEKQQHYMVGKLTQFLTIPLATGGVSLWVEIKAHTPLHAANGSFEMVGPSLVLSGKSWHWLPLYVAGNSLQRWSIARRVSVTKRSINKSHHVLNVQTLWLIGDAWLKGKIGQRYSGQGENQGRRYSHNFITSCIHF